MNTMSPAVRIAGSSSIVTLIKPEMTDAERKAARDARYAARKARKN